MLYLGYEQNFITCFRKAFKCDKMDVFSGSGSHGFISFHLGKKMSGQPTQENPEDMETNPSLLTRQATDMEAPTSADLEATVEHSSASDSEGCGVYFTR